ncbi:MAG: ferredoxin family protein [Lachnospiraceae bacterium]|nr:ferredoxin family protein [Lachnospiraceae bacterium]
MPPVIDKKKCIGCHTCADICPVDAYGLNQEKGLPPAVRYPEECWHCNACVFDCPVKAITLRIPVPASMVFTDAPHKG